MTIIAPITSAPYPSARRKATLWSNLCIGGQHVADAPNCMEQWRREVLVDLLPQAADLYVNRVGLRVEMIVPDRLEKHGSGHDLALMADQIFEQAELSRLQGDRL